MTEICPLNDCTGCYACLNICPRGAITMQENEHGVLYPDIQQEACIDCGLCQKVCPMCHSVELLPPRECIVAYAKSPAEQQTAASGGLASVVSRAIIRRGGVVYGSSAANAFDVKHIMVTEEEHLPMLKGSKYVHSKMGTLLRSLQYDLKSGRDVLFVGTPCQVAGARNFLRRDYPNFYTIDLVCHGVPPQKVLNGAIRYAVGDERNDIGSIAFRKKDERGRVAYGLYIKDVHGNEIYGKDISRDLYSLGFMKALFYRPNCYRCSYAQPNRVGDLTLGDYWDRENTSELPKERRFGMSMVMVNSDKGQKLMDLISQNIMTENNSMENFKRHNAQLVHPMKEHPMADQFWTIFKAQGFAGTEPLMRSIRRKMRCQTLIAKASRLIYKIPLAERIIKKILRRKS